MDLFLEFTQKTYKTSKGQDVATCSEIFYDQYKAKFIGYQLTGGIFITNMLLKIIVTAMIKGLRLSTVSFETKAITLLIFFAQFTNTVLLLTLKNFNTSDIFGHDSKLSAIFDGKDSIHIHQTSGRIGTRQSVWQ